MMKTIIISVLTFCLGMNLYSQERKIYRSNSFELIIDESTNKYVLKRKDIFQDNETDSISISGEEIVSGREFSNGKYQFKNGIYYCVDENHIKKYNFKQKSSYIIVSSNNTFPLVKNEIFFLEGVTDQRNTFQILSWKNSKKDGVWLYGDEKGISRVRYQDGVKVDSIFKSR